MVKLHEQHTDEYNMDTLEAKQLRETLHALNTDAICFSNKSGHSSESKVTLNDMKFPSFANGNCFNASQALLPFLTDNFDATLAIVASPEGSHCVILTGNLVIDYTHRQFEQLPPPQQAEFPLIMKSEAWFNSMNSGKQTWAKHSGWGKQ